jgi:hypothetical protein
MYMLGLFLTASRPSSTWMLDASYVGAGVDAGFSFDIVYSSLVINC